MKQRARYGLSARARPFPRQEVGEPQLIELRCGGTQYLLRLDEAGRLLAELDDAIDTAEAPDTEKRHSQ
jgi:hypothetical protein